MELSYQAAPEDAGKPLSLFLREQGISAGFIKSVKYGAGFFVNGVPVHTNHRLQPGQTVRFALPPEQPTTVQPQADIPLHIVYEDDFVLALNKPAGIAVHPTLNYPGGTLANAWMAELQRRNETGVFRPVNRIDKDTSGLVLCAKNSFAAPMLAETAEKRYYALVQGQLPLGRGQIDAPIGRRGDSIIGRCVCENGKPSCTEYTVLAVGAGHSLVRCRPITGRTHQIRVHFSYLGHPLAGDDLYGGSRQHIARQALHCGRVEFVHPVSKAAMRLECPMPPDFCRLLAEMEVNATTVEHL